MFKVAALILSSVAAPFVKTFVVFSLFSVALFSLRRAFSRLFFFLVYRPQFFDVDRVPEGAALLVGNSVGYLDELLIASRLKRRIAFVVSPEKSRRCFPVDVARRFGFFDVLTETGDALRARVRQILADGGLVCVFPEGDMTRSGRIKPFSDEFLSFVDSASQPIPIVPFFIGGFFGSAFSFADGAKMRWRPKRLEERLFLAFGEPIFAPTTAQRVEQTVAELGFDAGERTNRRLPAPQRRLIDVCRASGGRLLVADGTGVELSGRSFLIRTLVARRFLRRKVLERNEKNVGLLLPTSVGGCIANAALALDRRVAVNLNYTFGSEVLNYCCQLAEVRRILTTRKVLERFPNLKFDAKIEFLEDVAKKATLADKLFAAFDAALLPKMLLRFKLRLRKIPASETLAIIFTSGSTGKPKGVELSNGNVAAVARGFLDSTRVGKNDAALAALPLFHAFGYVGNFWMTFIGGCRGIFHFNPLDAKAIGELARKYRCTFLCCTPTFLRNYLRRRPREDFENLHTIMTGAEKLPRDLIDAWETKYGVRPTEGYGATELSPCPITNIPDVRSGFWRDDFSEVFEEQKRAAANGTLPAERGVGRDDFEIYRKDGSVGRAHSKAVVKIVDRETGADLDVDEVGQIAVKGPLVTTGYYNDPEATRQVVKNGWYLTGDVGRKDRDGFVWIVGRESRISKIGGEMTPHVPIEEAMTAAIQEALVERGVEPKDGLPLCAVTAVPDATKGEALVALWVNLGVEPEEIVRRMRERDLPNLWIPGLSRFIEVAEIPMLQTGKLDLTGIRAVANERFAPSQSE